MTELLDVVDSLGNWVGGVLPGIDEALKVIGDDTWKPGTRDRILQEVGRELVILFENREIAEHDTVEYFDHQATWHLARYAICRARAQVLKRDSCNRG